MVGEKLGSYEIVAKLGEGGMGAVYRARDARLDRDVAIKVLTEPLAKDETAMARFEREAMSVAKLSHPNILSIFEFVRPVAGDPHSYRDAYVVMELVDGETLRAKLANGPIPARKAVHYALQIARGLGAAHARGIVHRDLKPENVMVTRDDHVKILDFGLAKSSAANGPDTRTVLGAGDTQLANTTPGTVLGTFGYMAPEQVRGLPVDHRADMFAFGALLHEMLTGQRAFRGETAADTMSAILTREPEDIDLARLSVPPGLDRIVRRCLEKTPDLRFQSATDLAFALETLATGSSSSSGSVNAISGQAPVIPAPIAPARSTVSRALPWLLAAAALITALVAWMPRFAARNNEAAKSTTDTFLRVTELGGEETSPALSPDGQTAAYAVFVNRSWDIYAQRVGGRNATPILNDPIRSEASPAYSPDGASLAFHESDAAGGIFVAGATGESVRRVTEFGFHPAWSPNGQQLLFTTEEILDPASRLGQATMWIVDVKGGQPRKLVEGDAVQGSWSPSGERIVYWSNTGGQRDVFTVAPAGGTREPITNDAAIDWSPVWSPDGKYVYFSSDRGGAMNLWRIVVDQSTGKPSGSPEPVTMGVQAESGLPSFSRDGTRMAFRSRTGSTNPVEIPFDPVTLQAGEPRLIDTRNNIRIPSSVSKDGSLIAYFNIGERQEDLFVGPPNGPMRRVIDDAQRDRAPMFTPDGKTLLFYSNRGSSWQAWSVGVDGSGLHQLATSAKSSVYVIVSPKGDQAVSTDDSGRGTILMNVATGDFTTLANTDLNGNVLNPQAWSADGKRLAGALSGTSGRSVGVAFYDFDSKTTTQVSEDETYGVQWLPDSRRCMYFTTNGHELVVVDTVTRARTVVKVKLPAPAVDEVFAVRADGRAIYYGARRAEADIWILERK